MSSLSNRKHNMSSATKRRNREILARRDGNHCHWCGRAFGDNLLATIDHLHPRSQGGRNALWNLVLACRACNEKRADTPAAELAR
jgi:5-methylcytosine-specific restriction endonuclease McrA